MSIKFSVFAAFIMLYHLEWISLGFGDMKFTNSFAINSITTLIIDFAIAFSVIILFSLVLGSLKLLAIMSKKTLVNLGKISYSLYLVHIIVLLAAMHLFHPYLPNLMILPLILIFSILVAILFYFTVEKPSSKLGKDLPNQQVIKKKF